MTSSSPLQRRRRSAHRLACGRGWPRLSLAALVTAALLALPSTASFAQTPPASEQDAFDPLAAFPRDLRIKLDTKGDLTLRDSHLRDALLMVSELWDVDIAFNKEVTGDVNGVFKQRPLHEILNSILTINGYGYRPNGIGIVVQTLEELGESNPAFQSVTLSLPITSTDDKGVDQIVDGAKMFLSKQGKIQAIAATRSMVVVDYPDRVRRVQQFVRDLTAAATGAGATGAGAVKAARRFQLQHVTAEEMQAVLEGVIGESGKVASMTKENIVVVYGPKTLLDLADQLVLENDVPRPQVRITAYIYDISLDESERFGINWHHYGQGRNMHDDGMGNDVFGFNSGLLQTVEDAAETTGEMVDDTMTDGAAVGIQAGSMVIRSLGRNFSLESTIQALDETRGARLLAAPQATVQHLEEAIMKAVREVPYQQLTESTDGGSVGTTEFREAGITLTVTPLVAQDGTITLQVQPTFSVLAGFQEGQPIIDTREAKTRVRVNDGQMIVIGGLRQKSEVETVSGIPYLMHWKHWGKFFRAHSTTIVESELVVFIKPEIVNTSYIGDGHDEAAANVTVNTLDQMQYAPDGPFIPYCRDPYCPYHHPRPRGVVGVPPLDPSHCTSKLVAPIHGGHYPAPKLSPAYIEGAPPLAPPSDAGPRQVEPMPAEPMDVSSRRSQPPQTAQHWPQPHRSLPPARGIPPRNAFNGVAPFRSPRLQRLPPVQVAQAPDPHRRPLHPTGTPPATLNRMPPTLPPAPRVARENAERQQRVLGRFIR